jgi:hypothetical protein
MEAGVSSVSTAGGTGVSVESAGAEVCVVVGFAISEYAHRSSWVAVGETNTPTIDALTGDVTRKKMSPMLPNNRMNNRLGRRRMLPFE